MARDALTGDLFSWAPPEVAVGYASDVAGKGPLENRIARLLSRALRDARDEKGLTRIDIAARLSAELGRPVSADMLDKWTSEASGQHRIPLDAFIALIRVTGALDVLGFIPDLFGFAVVDRKYAGIIELQMLEEHESEIAAYKARLTAKIGGRR